MGTTRSEILKALKTGIVQVTGLHADRVKIGPWRVEQATGEARVMIFFSRDFGKRGDGKSRRMMTVTVGVLAKIDQSKSESELEQMSNFYDAVHAKMETLANGDVGAKVIYMREMEPGTEVTGLDDDDRVVYMGCNWSCEYERTMATT